MKRSRILEERRAKVHPEVRRSVGLSFQIVDRIHYILESKGLKQKDLAVRMGKSEAEVSKWMRGTHNFTIDTISSIEFALDASIIMVSDKGLDMHRSYPTITEFKSMKVAENDVDF